MSAPRWGILGTGRIGRLFARGVGLATSPAAASAVHAVASREYSRAFEYAKEVGIPRAFGSYDEMLASGEIDLVYNALPNSLHAEWTIRALEAGLPVLCEKPLTANADEARAVRDAARRTGRLAVEAFMYRFHPVYDTVFSLIQSGAIGEVRTVCSAFTFPLDTPGDTCASADLAGGSLMDVGCYCVSLSRWIAGVEPARVCAFERRKSVDDTLVGMLEFPNGVLAHFECGFESLEQRDAEIVGSAGAIRIEDPWTPGDNESRFILRRESGDEIRRGPGANPYQLEAEDFVRAWKTHEPPRWSLDDAVANMTVIDALYQSAREGKTTLVPPFNLLKGEGAGPTDALMGPVPGP